MNVRKDVWRTSTGCWPNLCEVHKYIRTLCYALLLCGPACLFILHNMALIDSYCCCSWTKGQRTQEVSECIDSPNRYKKKRLDVFQVIYRKKKKTVFVSDVLASHSEFIQSLTDDTQNEFMHLNSELKSDTSATETATTTSIQVTTSQSTDCWLIICQSVIITDSQQFTLEGNPQK